MQKGAGPARHAIRLLLFCGALFGAGCGYVGDPLPPLANVPGKIADLAAVQRGARLIVHFTPPAQTTEGFAIKTPLRLDLRVGTSSISRLPHRPPKVSQSKRRCGWTCGSGRQ
jgi:hypothetical protein